MRGNALEEAYCKRDVKWRLGWAKEGRGLAPSSPALLPHGGEGSQSALRAATIALAEDRFELFFESEI